jgi:branched-chain amino acid transport system ATP-binding protein
MLAVDRLAVSYGAVRALDGVSFDADPGSITAVLGANGAGKTTLLRAVSGLVRPTSGSVRLGELTLTGMSVERVVRQGVAHVPEGSGVIAELTVDQNLHLGVWQRTGRRARRASEERAFEVFPVLRRLRRHPASSLSGGERRMLAIAVALVSRPTVLLLDEPSLGLAPRVTAELMAALRDLADATRLTVVLVEQNVRSALSVARKAVIINLGRVVMSGTASEVASHPDLRHHYLGF